MRLDLQALGLQRRARELPKSPLVEHFNRPFEKPPALNGAHREAVPA